MEQSKNTKESKERNTVKLDMLRKIELEVQEQWEKDKLFECDAPEDHSQGKYLATFPYPYMNGRLHLGHGFTITKAEFASSYQRLKGKQSLFPFGFHCTGMPIKACADKLKREIELFGNPPVFPVQEQATEEQAIEEAKVVPADNTAAAANATKADPTAFHATKSKVAAKSSGAKSQWGIMQSLGVPDDEIARFADAAHWLKYFPPYCMDDLKKLGAGIDWRRSFITTDVNPYYDSFVRWQYETLKDLKKVDFGKRASVYSPKDGQPCADHDRSSGEGVLPQEYTLIKLQVHEPLPEKLKSLQGKKVYLVPGTLRPETMYGQTNVWVLPEGDYGAFEISDTDVFICTERSARNLAYQGFAKEFGKVVCLLKLKGFDLIGMPVKAPLSKYPAIYVLPMITVSPKKGTGIVTSVPSDSPDDYTCFDELKRKSEYRSRFGVTDEMIMPYEVIEIIDIPGLGTNAAETVCKQLKVNGPKDPKLVEAKETVYQKGFYEGKLIVGEYAGKLVQEAKPLIKEQLIKSGDAIVYYEPADVVMSRSGDECVVAWVDQWFLTYGEEKWKAQVEAHLKNMEFYSPDTAKKFEYALGWLNQWACSRSYGLGTKLPWDEQYLIESLSDSTIYMAFYAVSHLLQGGVIDGSKTGPSGIKPEQMTRAVWNYIYLSGDYPSDCGISEDVLKKMRNEFEFWYPVDLRVSGKDLINNHLVFFLYSHCAIFPKESQWPRSVRANGHVLLDGRKMAKSEGHFLTLSESVDRYSVDGTRFALADAGDSLDDANFSPATADGAILRLHSQIKWVEEILAAKDLRDTQEFADRVFDSEMSKLIRQTEQNYEKTNFREVIQTGFYAMQAARDSYKLLAADKGVNRELILKFIENQVIIMAPIIPHFCEHIWKLLGKTGSVRKARWPQTTQEDVILLQQKDFLFNLAHSFRLKKDNFMKPKKGKENEKVAPPTKAVVFVALVYPEWKQKLLTMLRPLFESSTVDDKEIMKFVTSDPELKKQMKKVMPFVAQTKELFKLQGISALDLKLTYDEREFLENNSAFIKRSLEINDLEVKTADEDMISKERCTPGQPAVVFE